MRSTLNPRITPRAARVRRRTPAAVSAAAVVAALVALPGGVAQAASPDIVISQVYGGGGNSGAPYANDFVELYNRGTTPVSVTGWTVQYASATGSSWSRTTLSGTIAPGHYFLVQEAAGAAPAPRCRRRTPPARSRCPRPPARSPSSPTARR